MTAYDIALFFHLLGVIAMFSGFAVYTRAGIRLRAATDMDQVRSWLGMLESSGPMFASGSVLLLVSGVYMMVMRWRAPLPWLSVALFGLLTIWIVGATVSGKHLRHIRSAVSEARGSISGELSFRIANPFAWTVVTALNGLALGIVFVMTTKPGWLGSIGVALGGMTIGAAVGASLLRKDQLDSASSTRAAQS
jgi:hypothetical protein